MLRLDQRLGSFQARNTVALCIIASFLGTGLAPVKAGGNSVNIKILANKKKKCKNSRGCSLTHIEDALDGFAVCAYDDDDFSEKDPIDAAAYKLVSRGGVKTRDMMSFTSDPEAVPKEALQADKALCAARGLGKPLP